MRAVAERVDAGSAGQGAPAVELTILIPCLNEAETPVSYTHLTLPTKRIV